MIELSCDAAAMIGDRAQVCIVPDANHLFSEPGALQQVAEPSWRSDGSTCIWHQRQRHSCRRNGPRRRKACPGTT
ncbi:MULTISPECIES: hypothetical protein [Catellatospora]|uniref:hypothetical protein n=1 Tax=Catellatospora TaxID=53365 RepID=UPI00118425CC|nr:MULTISPECIES: hypothetical protein [Catellatospora]